MRQDLVISFDVETVQDGRAESALDLHRGARVFAFSFMIGDEGMESGRKGKYARPAVILREDREPSRFWRMLRNLWEKESAPKVMHNAKFDIMASIAMGVKVPMDPDSGHLNFHDTMVMSRLLHSKSRSHGLKNLCADLGRYPVDDEAAVKKIVSQGVGYDKVPPYIMDVYQERDAERCLLLFKLFWPMLKVQPRLMRLYDMERAIILCSIDIERRGVLVNRRRGEKLIRRLEKEVNEMASRFPPWLDIDKTESIRRLLYEEGGLPILKRTKKSKAPATDKDTIKELIELHPKNEALRLLLKWRSYKGGITRLQSYLDLAEPDGTLRTWLNPYGAYTGRESSERPNLQNISKKMNPANPFPVPGRDIFQPRPGFVNFHIDFAGIELRLLIAASGDPGWIKIISEGGDPHAIAAEIFFGKLFTEEKDKDKKKGIRYIAKTLHFAMAYGAGLVKMHRVAEKPVDFIKQGVARYQKRFPRFANLNKELKKQAATLGYVETLFGRRIHIDPTKPYVATNNLIQAFAADIFKEAQVRVWRLLPRITAGRWKIILPIHDELIIEAPREDLPIALGILLQIREEMIRFPEIPVPLEVEVEYSTTSWASLHEFDLFPKEVKK